VDVWSCGVVLFAMLCGSLPFDDENIPRLFKKIRSGVFSFPTNAHVDPRARDLIKRMLHKDQLERITVDDIWKHPWFKQDLAPYLLALRVRSSLRAFLTGTSQVPLTFHDHTLRSL
jgi:serine/threonine protein kinase